MRRHTGRDNARRQAIADELAAEDAVEEGVDPEFNQEVADADKCVALLLADREDVYGDVWFPDLPDLDEDDYPA